MSLKVVLIALLFVVSGFAIPISAQTVTTSTTTSQTTTLTRTSYPPAFGMDVGPALWGFNAKGFWFMSGTSNTTLSLVTWVGLVGPTAVPNHKCGSALVWSFSHNSTTYIYTGVPPSAVACSGSSLTPLVHLYISNVTGAYNQKEISGSVSTVRTGVAQFVMNQILFSLTSTAQASVCDSKSHVVNGQTVPPCNSQQFSQTAFSWGAITTPSYNNATHVLTANSTVSLVSGTSFPFDPLAIDGSAYCVESSGGTCTTTTLTTSHSPDVIIVMEHSTGNYCTAPTGTGLSFSLRVNNHAGDGDCVAEYYAIASSTYSHTLVCNWSGSYAEGCTAFGISGANTASPFDANSAIPCSSNGNSGSSNIPSCTISTSNAADFIITMVSEGNSHTFTPPSGYTNIGGCSGSRYCDAYGVVSSTYSGFALSWSSLGDTFWDNVVDAIVSAAGTVTQPITLSTLPSGAPSGTITWSGCALTNGTATANGFTKHMVVTASCTITLTASGVSGSTRYVWSGANLTLTFTTCTGPGTCAGQSHNVWYQLTQTFTFTPQTPSTWDGVYAPTTYGPTLSGTYIGTAATLFSCPSTTAGGGAVTCAAAPGGGAGNWYDYNAAVTVQSPIGNTWLGTAPLSFTDTTGGNTHNVNYIQSSGSTTTTTTTTTSTITTTATTTATSTTTTTTTPGQIIGGNENDPLVPFLVVLCFIVILVAAVLVRRRNVVNSRYLESG